MSQTVLLREKEIVGKNWKLIDLGDKKNTDLGRPDLALAGLFYI